MNIRVTLSKEEYESVLLDLINRTMSKDIPKSAIKSVSLSYNPEAESPMTITLDLPPNTTL